MDHCEHNACKSIRLTTAGVELVEQPARAGVDAFGRPYRPYTEIRSTDDGRLLGTMQDNGYRTHPDLGGEWVHEWLVFAGGSCVALPLEFWEPSTGRMVRTDKCREATVAAFVQWCSHTAFTWRLALHG
jgi:hypothetical protein